MNYANHKTTLNTIKENVILIGILANICTNVYILNQLNNMASNQEAILQSQNNIITELNDTYDKYITTEVETGDDDVNETDIDKVVYESVQVEEITASSESKIIIEKEDNYTLEEMKVPNCDTSFKSYMSYKCITNKASEQYKLQLSAWTDDMGLRRVDDYYLVAMGTYYSDTVGDKFRITLEGDKTFNVMIGDIKADIHTDKNNMYSPVYDSDGKFRSANVIEFIIDTKSVDRKVKLMGDVSAYEEFKGNIVKIERISD